MTARYDSGERRKTTSNLKLKYDQVLPVSPMAAIGGSPVSPFPITSGLKYINQLAGNELNPIGSYIVGKTSFSNGDFLAISTSDATFITIANWPRLQAYLPPRQTLTTYSFGTASTHYEWLYCSTPDKWVQFVSGSTTINVFTASSWPNSPVAKTSPFTMGSGAAYYPCVVAAYGNGKLVALNRYGGGVSNLGMTSSDLSTFTQFTFPVSGYYPNIVWNGTVYCATMYVSSVSYAYTSPDGTTWTQRQNFGNLGELLISSSNAGVLLAVQIGGTAAYLSTNNGASFAYFALPVSATWSDVCFDGLNNQFALVSSTYIVLISTTGTIITYYATSFPYAPKIKSTTQGLVIGYTSLLFSRTGKDWGMLYSSQKPYAIFYDLYSDGTNIIFRYRRNSSSTEYFDSDKIVFSTTELELQPISAIVSGTQYFLKGK